jgi:preprotein translocase subunit YajC
MVWLTLLAEDPPQQPPFFANPIFMLLIVFVIFYVFMIGPERRRRRELMAKIASAKKGDKVLTNAGIIGTIVAIKDGENEMTLKVDDTSGSRIRMLKSTIAEILAVSGEDGKDKEGETRSS